MSGPSGAGKTTYAKKLAEERGIQYLGIDDFYRMFNGSESRHEDEFEVWLAFYEAIHLVEKHGRDCVVDTNSPTVSKRTEFLDWFPSFEHHLIYITASQELCWQNNQSRTRKIPRETFNDIYDSVQPPTDNEDPRWVSIQRFTNYCNTRFVKQ